MELTRVVAPTPAQAAAPSSAARAALPPMPPVPTAPGTAAELKAPRAVPGEHIVVFRPDITPEEQQSLIQTIGPISTEPLPSINGMLISTDPTRAPGLGKLTPDQRSKILFTQPNYYQHLIDGEGTAVVDGAPAAPVSDAAAGSDPDFAKQYHLQNTGQTGGTPGADAKVAAAWAQSRGKGVVVALLDTNIDITHPDIAPNIWVNSGEIAGNGKDDDNDGYVDDVNGWNFGTNTNRPQDGGQTHGTHTAGTIGAVQGNGVGGAGVAPDVTLMPLAVLTSSATTANAIKAFDFAVKHGANILSNSWGANTYEPAMAAATKQASDAGVSIVVAAGNENWDTGVHGSYPDNYAGSFSVAASDAKDAKADYSNRGTITIDVAAPGDKQYSTLPGGRYGTMSGTSMAAPVVSGILALVKARYPELSMKEVEQRVLRSVQTDGAAKVWNTLVASGGRVDAVAALTPIATPAAPAPASAPVAGAPVKLGWSSDISDGQRFEVEVSGNANAKRDVAEDFETGAATRRFTTSGDRTWAVTDKLAQTGTKSFAVEGLTNDQQSRLELTETVTEPTEISFSYNSGKADELSFFIDRELQQAPSTGTDWREFRTQLAPGTHTFTWLAAGKSRQSAPIAIDNLRIGSVSDATWTKVGTTDAGATGIDWTPAAATGDAAVRVRADNGRFKGDWVQGASFPVTSAT